MKGVAGLEWGSHPTLSATAGTGEERRIVPTHPTPRPNPRERAKCGGGEWGDDLPTPRNFITYLITPSEAWTEGKGGGRRHSASPGDPIPAWTLLNLALFP